MSGIEVVCLLLPLLCAPALSTLAMLEYSTPSPVRFDFCTCKFVRKDDPRYKVRNRARFGKEYVDSDDELERPLRPIPEDVRPCHCQAWRTKGRSLIVPFAQEEHDVDSITLAFALQESLEHEATTGAPSRAICLTSSMDSTPDAEPQSHFAVGGKDLVVTVITKTSPKRSELRRENPVVDPCDEVNEGALQDEGGNSAEEDEAAVRTAPIR